MEFTPGWPSLQTRAPLSITIYSDFHRKDEHIMITVLVTFELKEPISRKKAKALFLTSAPNYRKFKGVIRKHFLLSETGKTAGASTFGTPKRMQRLCIHRTGRGLSWKNTALSRLLPIFPVRLLLTICPGKSSHSSDHGQL